MRAIIHGPYVAYYVASTSAIIIVRVLHGARDTLAMAARGELNPPD